MSTVSKYMTEHHNLMNKLFDNYSTMRKEEHKKTLQCFNYMSTQLLRHIDWEEEILFPLFETRFNHASSTTYLLKKQHSQIKQNMDEIKHELTKYPYNTEELEEDLKSLLGVHNATEEYAVYSWIDYLMSDEEKQRLTLEIQSCINIYCRGMR